MLYSYSIHLESHLLPLCFQSQYLIPECELLLLNMPDPFPERLPVIQVNGLPELATHH